MPTTFTALRVLVIEDHPIQRMFAENKLRALGIHDVESVGNGDEAIQALGQRPFDVVLCDICMPDCNGPELIADLMNRGRGAFAGRAPMWVWLSNVTPDVLDSHRTLASGNVFPRVHALKKPLQSEALRLVLQEAVDLPRDASAEPRLRPAPHELQDLAAHPEALRVMLQPQFSLAAGTLAGAEALCRWQHPKLGLLSADQFVQAMEDLDIADSIFFKVSEQVLSVQARLLAAGIRIPISINASAQTLCKPDSVTQFDAMAAAAGIAPDLLTIELTEETPNHDPLGLSVAMNRLRLLGYGVAIDDFGVGIATLKLLADLPFTQLKIDRSFVAEVVKDSHRAKICRSMIRLAADLGVECVAEGVESDMQRASLKGLGCDMGQGYLWSPAQPVERFMALAKGWCHG